MAPKVLASHEERLRAIGFFTDTVPFEETASKIYRIDKGVKVIVTNKRLFQTIRTGFTRQGFLVEAVVPMTMLGKEFGTPSGMTDELVKKILTRFEAIKANSLLYADPGALTGTPAAAHIQMSTKVQSKREYALIGVFVVLLLVLGGIAYMTFFSAQATPKKVASISVEPPAAPSVAAPVTPVSSESALLLSGTPVASNAALLNKAALRIAISGGTPEKAAGLKQLLVGDGFTNVTLRPSSAVSNAKILVIFTSTIPQDTREALLTEIKKVDTNVSAQENTLTDTDILNNL
jgi:hypothetical protein